MYRLAPTIGVWLVWLVWLLRLVTVASPAVAQADAPLVTTVIDACVPVDRAQLDRVLAIELGTSAESASSQTGPTHVHVRCVDAGIELNLEDALTRKTMVRVLPSDSFQDASSTRLLALAIAELIVASWVELRLPRKVEPVGPPPSTAARSAAARAVEKQDPGPQPLELSERSTEIALTGLMQAWSEQDAILFGAGARLVHAPTRWLAFSVAADLALATVENSLGNILLRASAVSVAGLVRLPLKPFVLLTGPGGRLGLAQISGEATDPRRVRSTAFYAPYGGLLWLARAGVAVSESFSIVLDLELGVTTLPIRGLARNASVVALDGAFLTAGLGVALTL